MAARTRIPSKPDVNVLQNSKPDYAAWLRRDAFTRNEIILLAIGIDPKSALAADFQQMEVKEIRRRYSNQPNLIEVFNVVQELISIFERSIEGGALKPYRDERYIPRDRAMYFVAETGLYCKDFGDAALAWAKLQAKLDEIGSRANSKSAPSADESPTANDKPAAKEKTLLTRERDTVLKLIGGMAIKGYGYDAKSTRSTVAGEIARDLHELGISLDEDTVRKWLREAVSAIDEKAP